MPTRHATAAWEGGIKNGRGRFNGQTGLAAQFNFSSRFESGPGSNPEELLAAAQAACFSMALALGLQKAGHEATAIETDAGCTISPDGGGFTITTMALKVRVRASGLDAAKLEQIVQATKEGCPVSKALRGNVKLDVEAHLVS